MTNALPDGWQVKSVRSLFEVNYGKGLTKSSRNDSGTINVYGSNGIVGQHTAALTDKPCLIIGRKGAAGAVQIARQPSWPIDTTYYAYPNQEIDIAYGFYVLSHLRLGKLDKSTAIPSLSRDDLHAQELPIPSLEEQQRIVDEIEKQFTRLDAAVAALERVQANLARYKASVLKAACEGRLVAQDEGDESAEILLARISAERRRRWQANHPGKRYVEPVGVDSAEMSDLPPGWIAVAIGDVLIEIQTGPFGSSLHKSDYVPNGIPVVNPASIIDGRIEPIAEMAIDEETRERLIRFVLSDGDVVMGRRGEMGRCAAVTDREAGWLCGTGSLVLRFGQPISRQYIVYMFGSEPAKAYLSNQSVGTTMQNLNQKILLGMVIGLPPEAEQQRIVAEVERRLSVVAAVESVVAANLARAARLRQSILQRAFSGQLELSNNR